MIAILLSFSTMLLGSTALAAEDRREVSPVVMGESRDYFAKIYRETYGADADGTTYVSCRSMDKEIGLSDLYLLRPRPPASPVLVYFNRDYFQIGNIGTVRYFQGEVDMWPGNGANGTAEIQRIIVEPLLTETFLPAKNIADVFMIEPTKKCAFAESKFYGRPAMPAPK